MCDADIWQVDKAADGEVVKKKLFGVMVSSSHHLLSSDVDAQYVPLTDAEKQWGTGSSQ